MPRESSIAVLGAGGQVGRHLCRLFRERLGIEPIQTGRHPGFRFLDIDQPSTYAQALTGISLLVIAAPTGKRRTELYRACLQAKCDVVDISTGGACAHRLDTGDNAVITEAGVCPGLPAAMVRLCRKSCTGITGAAVRFALRLSLKGYERPEQLHSVVDAAAASRLSYRARPIQIDFGGSAGICACLPLILDELASLPASAYAATPNWRADLAVRSLIRAAYAVRQGWGRNVFAKLLLSAANRGNSIPGITLLAEAKSGTAVASVRLAHTNVAEFTALATLTCVEQRLRVRIPHGMHRMGDVLDLENALPRLIEGKCEVRAPVLAEVP